MNWFKSHIVFRSIFLRHWSIPVISIARFRYLDKCLTSTVPLITLAPPLHTSQTWLDDYQSMLPWGWHSMRGIAVLPTHLCGESTVQDWTTKGQKWNFHRREKLRCFLSCTPKQFVEYTIWWNYICYHTHMHAIAGQIWGDIGLTLAISTRSRLPTQFCPTMGCL